MKKTVALLLIAAVAASASCGGNSSIDSDDSQHSQTTIPVTEEIKTDGLPEVDMDGFSLNVLHHDKSWLSWAETLMSVEEENGELINDEVYKRNSYIEDRFNCELNIEGVNQTNGVYRQLVQSGSTEYDVIFQYGLNVLGNVDYMSDFGQIPYLKLDEAHWNPKATEVFRVGEKYLAVAGNWTLSYLSGAMTYTFNKRVFDDLNTGKNLYELVDDGKWTIDEYYSVAKLANLDLNGNGVFGEPEDLSGITGQAKAYWNSLVIGAGFRYVEFDKDYMPSFALAGNEKMISMFEKIVEVETANPGIFPMAKITSIESNPGTNMSSGNTLFYVGAAIGLAGSMREMEDDFGIIPPPKYDENQEQYLTYANIGEIATLPRSYDVSRAENIGILMEAMSWHSQENLVPAYIDTVLSVKATRDDDSARMLDLIFSGIVFDYGTVVWQNDITGVLFEGYLIPRSSALVSTIEKIDQSLDVKFEELFEAVDNMP